MPKKGVRRCFPKAAFARAGNVFRYSAPHAGAVKSAICRKTGRQAKIERICAAEKEGPASVSGIWDSALQDSGQAPLKRVFDG